MAAEYITRLRSPVIQYCDKEKGGQILKDEISDRRVALVASKGCLHRAGWDFLGDEVLRHDGVWISSVQANPDIQTLTDALVQLYGHDVSKIIAIGGGSAIDLAKASAAMSFTADCPTYEVVELAIIEKSYRNNRRIPSIVAVPTTAGTGSEVTRWATIWDQRKGKKLSVESEEVLPGWAVIIPELTLDMPVDLTLSTGLDALSHAMESFWSKARNPISQAVALSAVKRIMLTMPRLLERLQDLSLREEMCTASLLAGVAFSQTRTTACHSISYPLTLQFQVPHGFAAAVTLADVAERNADAVPEIQQLLALFEPFGGLPRWMERVCASYGGLRLRRFGIGIQDISQIVDGAFTLGRMDNNPVHFTRDSVAEILQKCL